MPSAPLRFIKAFLTSPGVKPRDARTSVLVRTVEIALVALTAVLAALFVWRLWGVMVPAKMPLGDPISAAVTPSGPSARLALNPFALDEASGEAAVGVIQEDELQETSLDLTLYGAWIDQSGGTAFIGEKDGPQKRYRVGDTIVSGVTLEEVHQEWVAISRGGVYEALRIKNRKTPLTGSALQAPAQTQKAPSTTTATEEFSLDQVFSFSADANGRIIINPGKDAIQFAALGFEPGDVLTAVDGVVVAGIQSAPEIYNTLKNSTSARITVERDGAPATIDVSVKPGGAGGDDDDA